MNNTDLVSQRCSVGDTEVHLVTRKCMTTIIFADVRLA